jgi:hypothetical protein
MRRFSTSDPKLLKGIVEEGGRLRARDLGTAFDLWVSVMVDYFRLVGIVIAQEDRKLSAEFDRLVVCKLTLYGGGVFLPRHQPSHLHLLHYFVLLSVIFSPFVRKICYNKLIILTHLS